MLALVIRRMTPVLMKVAQKMEVMIRLTCLETVGYPMTLISLMFIVLITMLMIVTRTVTKFVRARPTVWSF